MDGVVAAITEAFDRIGVQVIVLVDSGTTRVPVYMTRRMERILLRHFDFDTVRKRAWLNAISGVVYSGNAVEGEWILYKFSRVTEGG